jgi:hypothetical protein
VDLAGYGEPTGFDRQRLVSADPDVQTQKFDWSSISIKHKKQLASGSTSLDGMYALMICKFNAPLTYISGPTPQELKPPVRPAGKP